jgi:hypothetical protein
VCPADAIDIADEHDERIMETWHRTSLRYQQCVESKESYAPERLIRHVGARSPDVPQELKDLSADSRRIKVAADFFLKPGRKQ